jgi:lipoprotein signal peptidase
VLGHDRVSVFLFKRAEGTMFGFYSNQLGWLGSIAVSVILSVLLIVVMRSCSG